MGFIDVIRYTFYALDFIFGVMSWGLTSDKLELSGFCLLSNSLERADSTPTCDVVIAFGVVTMILLLVVVVLRTLDIMGKLKFPELIEFFSFLFMALIWFILAVVMVSVTNVERRKLGRVRGAIAGAWIAFITHTVSAGIPIIARGKETAETETETKE